MHENFWLALGLTFFAGFATIIGSVIGVCFKKSNTKFLSVALGFSAGVMLYVSLIEIFGKGKEMFLSTNSESVADWLTASWFFAGILFIAAINFLLHSKDKVKKPKKIVNPTSQTEQKSLLKMGLFTALAVGLHNAPEGLATFMSALSDPQIGVSIAIAIAIHNIPEGIAVSTPIYYATGKKGKAFLFSFLSGLTEPIAAILGYFILQNFITDSLMGGVFAFVAGIMVFIAIAELLPTARSYGKHSSVMVGFFAGMAVMALSLLIV